MKRTVDYVSLADRAACAARLLTEVVTCLAAEGPDRLPALRALLGQAASLDIAAHHVEARLKAVPGGPGALYRAVGPLTHSMDRDRRESWLYRTGLATELYRDVAAALMDPA